jgi:type II secretory ATPase GspE/PulE/Tfp pilus assembly ATPase PilB-like protein
VLQEILNIDDELKEMMIFRKPLYDIKEKAMKKGMKLFHQTGKELALKKITTDSEVRRVIGQDPESIVF